MNPASVVPARQPGPQRVKPVMQSVIPIAPRLHRPAARSPSPGRTTLLTLLMDGGEPSEGFVEWLLDHVERWEARR